MFISGFFSQWEGVLDRYAPLLVTVHLKVQLMQTTVDTIFKASQAASKLKLVTMFEDVTGYEQIKNEQKIEELRKGNRGYECTIIA